MPIALIRSEPGGRPYVRGVFVSDGDALSWAEDVETLIDADAVAAGQFMMVPVEVDYPHIVLSLQIENTYELYDDVTTHAQNIIVPLPPAEDDDEYDDWYQTNILEWSGVGHNDGKSWYDFTVTASSDETVLPVGRKYGWGY